MTDPGTASPAPRRFAPSALVLPALVLLALGLRLWRVRLGLPDFLEEAIPLRLALGMKDAATGHVDWNPHNFNYPSLSIYLHFVVQQIAYGLGLLTGAYHRYADYLLAFDLDPTAMVVPARLVGIVCDALALVAAVRLGERLERGSGWIAGLLVALSPLLIVTSRSIFCDSLMSVLALWSLERMLAWEEGGRTRDLVLAAVLVGLAAGAKYPAGALVLPMGWLLWRRRGEAGLLPWAGLSALSLAAFLATTPFALLDPRAFWHDFSFEGGHATGGHLGSEGHLSFGFHLGNLVHDLGWLGAALLAVSLVLAARHARSRPGPVALWIALLSFGVPISLARIDAGRYLVPVLLVAAPLAAAAGVAVLARVPAAARRWAAPAGAVLLVAPVLVPGIQAAGRGADTTQLEARRWCQAHLGRDALLVQEGYAARLPTDLLVRAEKERPRYRLASPALRARLDSLASFHVVALPLAVSGRVTTTIRPPASPPVTVEVLDHADRLNRVFYDPLLFAGADYVMTSSAVRGRYQADPARFPTECALYALLDEHAPVAARFAPRGAVIGPEIVVYRIGDAYRSAIGDEPGPDSLWWTAAIPERYRIRVGVMLGAEGDRAGGNGPPPWVRSLAGLYARRIAPFVSSMGNELALLGRNRAARAYASATLALDPTDADACAVYAVCSARLGRWGDARAATGRALSLTPEAGRQPALVLLHARALEHTGDARAALAEYRGLEAALADGDPIRAEAERAIAVLRARGGKG